MGFIKNLIIIVMVLIALSYVFPTEFDQGKQWVVDQAVYRLDTFLENRDVPQIQNVTNTTFEYIETEFGNDYGKILGRLDCQTDNDCIDYFNIESLTCSTNGTCIEEVD